MGAFISRQPNGLYCRFSSVVDCPTHYNMTSENYIEYCIEKAKEEAMDVLSNHLRPFSEVVDHFAPNNMSEEEFAEFLKIVSKSE
ncbi:MAG: hypothetical protein WA125_17005 [Desulfosporosinus sp.]